MSADPDALRIERLAEDGGLLFRLTGYLDLSTVDLLRAAVGPACGSGDEIRLDLSGLSFCDSTGVGALVWLYRRASVGTGRLVVYAPRKAVREVLRISGVDRVIPVLAAPTGSTPTGSAPTGSTAVERQPDAST